MTSRDFCFWLQGYLELSGPDNPDGISIKQRETIAQHLALVFKHEIDPSMGPPAHQAALNAIHGDYYNPPPPPLPPKPPQRPLGSVTDTVMRC